ncbi:hypothetical protein BVY01_03485 [bacterium I07]|nr:hypothetical protein BVY01_03485 [bacterium I07]
MNTEYQKQNQKLNRIIGGAVFLISFMVFFRTVAQTTSFWDCGEFIACSRILGVMHPPGAPLYLLIGRILTLIPIFEDIGMRVNMFSVFISAATVLLTYMVIAQLINRWRGEPQNTSDRWILFASAFIGALAFAFTDSFWFNAVEAEVYAFSMFFTALVVWLALYWGERSEQAGSLLLIFFMFYIFGLATVVHLLNILAFPVVLLIAFFHHNQTVKRLLLLIFIQAAVPILLYSLLYQYNPEQMMYDFRAHQAKAGSFLKWFGLIWIVASLTYFYVKDRSVFNAWWVIPVLVIVGYSLYYVIYIRAGLAPPINENNPSTPQAMMDYLARKQYGEHDQLLTFMHRKAEFWNYQIHRMYTRYFGWQFIGKGTTLDLRDRIVEVISFKGLYGLPFLLGLWGAVHHFFKDWKRAVVVGVLFLLTGYAIIIYLNQPDPQPRERDYSYVGSFFAFALWIGIGVAGLLEWVSGLLKNNDKMRKWVFAGVSVILFLAVPFNLFSFNFESHDRRGNYIAWDYSLNILETCEPDAIIFTNGDNDTFPLWFLQEVYNIRKDIRVINLSLLNTPWYIKQLRDQEPKIAINLKDASIDAMNYERWETRVVGITLTEQVRKEQLSDLQKENPALTLADIPQRMTFSVAPTYPTNNPQVIRVQDIMVLQIIEANRWKRPVYFAVTVSQDNMIGLNQFLRMDGLAYRVTPFPTTREIEPETLKTHLLDKFQYRGLGDESVYFNTNIVKLLQNYRSAFIQLVRYYIEQGEIEAASKMLDEMSRKIPAQHIPYSHERLAVLVAELYNRVGRAPEAENQLNYVIPGSNLSDRERQLLKTQYAMAMGDWDQAESFLLKMINDNPNDAGAYSELVQVYRLSKQFDKGINLLNGWLAAHPGDTSAEQALKTFKSMAKSDSASSGTEP